MHWYWLGQFIAFPVQRDKNLIFTNVTYSSFDEVSLKSEVKLVGLHAYS